MKNNNKGFTLIELLISVAIMLTIMGVAVVNFLTISDRKKTEAWGSVKNEIETAAEQYFKSNQYLFEGLSGNMDATISVGKLVDEDFLNKVIDPRTGKSVSACMIVKVTISNGVYSANLIDNVSGDTDNCNNLKQITVSENGAPSIETHNKICSQKGNGEWCILGGDNSVTFNIKYNENGNGKIIKKMMNIEGGSNNYNEYGFSLSSNESEKTVAFKSKTETNQIYGVEIILKNSNGKTAKYIDSYGLDVHRPVENGFGITRSGFNSNKEIVSLSGKITDSGSGIRSISGLGYTHDSESGERIVDFSNINTSITLNKSLLGNSFEALNGSTISAAFTFSDIAGNSTTINKSYNTYKMIDCPSAPEILATAGNLVGGMQWYKQGENKINGTNYYFALRIVPAQGTQKWDWYTNKKMENCTENCETINGVAYKNNSSNVGSRTKGLSSGTRRAYVKIYDQYNNNKYCSIGPYYVDTDKPRIGNDLENSSGGNWTNQKVIVTATGSDTGGSGIDKWQYSYDDNRFSDIKSERYNSDKTIARPEWTKQRNATAYIRLCDVAGNCSDTKNTQIRIDTERPVLSCTSDRESRTYIGKSKLNAYDSNGVQRIVIGGKVHDLSCTHSDTGGSGINYESLDTDKSAVNNIVPGQYTRNYSIKDNAGNTSDVVTQVVKVLDYLYIVPADVDDSDKLGLTISRVTDGTEEILEKDDNSQLIKAHSSGSSNKKTTVCIPIKYDSKFMEYFDLENDLSGGNYFKKFQSAHYRFHKHYDTTDVTSDYKFKISDGSCPSDTELISFNNYSQEFTFTSFQGSRPDGVVDYVDKDGNKWEWKGADNEVSCKLAGNAFCTGLGNNKDVVVFSKKSLKDDKMALIITITSGTNPSHDVTTQFTLMSIYFHQEEFGTKDGNTGICGAARNISSPFNREQLSDKKGGGDKGNYVRKLRKTIPDNNKWGCVPWYD